MRLICSRVFTEIFGWLRSASETAAELTPARAAIMRVLTRGGGGGSEGGMGLTANRGKGRIHAPRRQTILRSSSPMRRPTGRRVHPHQLCSPDYPRNLTAP